jgi:hypothetical protein
MKNNERIILGFFITLIFGLVIFGVYEIFSREKYTKLKNMGYFPIFPTFPTKKSITMELDHKYSGHRYKQKRRYNFLSQQNRINQ